VKGPTYRSEEEEGSGASFESHVIWGEWRSAAEMLETGDLVKLVFDDERARLDAMKAAALLARRACMVGSYLPTHLRFDPHADGYWQCRLEQPAQPARLFAGEFKAVAS